MCFSSGGDGGAGEARAAEARRENAINDGMNNINDVFRANFTPEFFTKRRQAYLDYAKPQLEDQYADTRKQLLFSLDRSGMLDSTARTQKEAELAKLYGQNTRSVSDAALNYENAARDNVTSAQSNLIGTVAQSGNANAAGQAAINQASVLSQPDVYSPLGQLFGSFTNALTTQAALENAGVWSGGTITPSLGYTGLFGPNPRSVKVYA